MAISATDVVAPVFAAAKVVVFFLTGVTRQTRFRDFFRRLVLEGDDFLWVAFFTVGLAWTMTCLATRHLVFPATDFDELGVRGMREGFELIFVAILASLTAYIAVSVSLRNFALSRLG